MVTMRWYIFMLAVGTMLWALLLSYMSVMLKVIGVEWLNVIVWVKWLTYATIGFGFLVFVFPIEQRMYEKQERQENKKVGNRKE